MHKWDFVDHCSSINFGAVVFFLFLWLPFTGRRIFLNVLSHVLVSWKTFTSFLPKRNPFNFTHCLALIYRLITELFHSFSISGSVNLFLVNALCKMSMLILRIFANFPSQASSMDDQVCSFYYCEWQNKVSESMSWHMHYRWRKQEEKNTHFYWRQWYLIVIFLP